jgi:hypothetical protein
MYRYAHEHEHEQDWATDKQEVLKSEDSTKPCWALKLAQAGYDFQADMLDDLSRYGEFVRLWDLIKSKEVICAGAKGQIELVRQARVSAVCMCLC